MKIRRHSKNYNFIGDTQTGTTFRWGESYTKDPKFTPWPELADISISNHCSKGCDFCYRNSVPNNSFISLNDYQYLLEQLQHPIWGNVFQVAFGGGEPLEHPEFVKIINITRDFGVVPNFTTNGKNLTTELILKLKRKVGAIALSTINIQTIDLDIIEKMKKNDIKYNIHYVLSNYNINQAISILHGRYNNYLQKVNSIIFLTYKSTGRADNSRILRMNKSFLNFVSNIEDNTCSTRIGFDACFVPMLMHFTNIDLNYIDPCECSFFSVYIDENLRMSPCSFSNDQKDTYSIKEYSIEHIWTKFFKEYRSSLSNDCNRECQTKTECRGRCPYFDNLTLCFISNEQTGESYAN